MKRRFAFLLAFFTLVTNFSIAANVADRVSATFPKQANSLLDSLGKHVTLTRMPAGEKFVHVVFPDGFSLRECSDEPRLLYIYWGKDSRIGHVITGNPGLSQLYAEGIEFGIKAMSSH